MTKIYRCVLYHIYYIYCVLSTNRFSVMIVDDVWGMETQDMNQSGLDRNPGAVNKDKWSVMIKTTVTSLHERTNFKLYTLV